MQHYACVYTYGQDSTYPCWSAPPLRFIQSVSQSIQPFLWPFPLWSSSYFQTNLGLYVKLMGQKERFCIGFFLCLSPLIFVTFLFSIIFSLIYRLKRLKGNIHGWIILNCFHNVFSAALQHKIEVAHNYSILSYVIHRSLFISCFIVCCWPSFVCIILFVVLQSSYIRPSSVMIDWWFITAANVVILVKQLSFI